MDSRDAMMQIRAIQSNLESVNLQVDMERWWMQWKIKYVKLEWNPKWIDPCRCGEKWINPINPCNAMQVDRCDEMMQIRQSHTIQSSESASG